MGQSQWMHVDAFGESPLRDKASAQGMVEELDRKPSGSNHLKKAGILPKMPIPRFLASTPVSCLMPLLAVLKAENMAKTGHPARKNAALLLGGVATWPVPVETLKRDKSEWLKKEAWGQDLDAWIRRRWPTVYAIVEHVDETYAHHHWVCLPFSTDSGLTLASMHPGKEAGKNAKQKAKETHGWTEDDARLKHAYNVAYKEAMRDLLDDYWESVGKAHELTRTGGLPRARTSRKEHLATQAAEKKVASKLEKLEVVNSWLKSLGTSLDDVLAQIATVANSKCNCCATVANSPQSQQNQGLSESAFDDFANDQILPTKKHQPKM